MRQLFTNAKAHAFKNDEERNTLAKEYQAHHNAEIRDRLIIGNIDKVYEVISCEFSDSSLNMQDMVSEGITGLIDAIDTFGTDKQIMFTQIMINKGEISFVDYIYLVIRNTILKACEQENRADLSIEVLRKYEHRNNNSSLIDRKASFELYTLKEDALNKIISIANRLDDKSKEVVFAYYGVNGSPMNEEEIYKETGVPVDHIKIIINNIEAALRAQIDLDAKQK